MEFYKKELLLKEPQKKLVFQMIWKDKDGHMKIFTRRKNANKTMIKSVISFFKPYILLKDRNWFYYDTSLILFSLSLSPCTVHTIFWPTDQTLDNQIWMTYYETNIIILKSKLLRIARNFTKNYFSFLS